MNNGNKSQFEYILFDLDETLYPKEAGLMDAIGERILIFMTQRVGIPADDATIKRRKYYQQYGTSLRGLMVEYNIDPVDYLDFVHAVDPHEFLLHHVAQLTLTDRTHRHRGRGGAGKRRV